MPSGALSPPPQTKQKTTISHVALAMYPCAGCTRLADIPGSRRFPGPGCVYENAGISGIHILGRTYGRILDFSFGGRTENLCEMAL